MSNRFECLADTLDADVNSNFNGSQDDFNETTDNNTDSSHTFQNKNNNGNHATSFRDRKPPPIYLASKVNNFSEFSNQLKLSVGDNFHLKFLGNQIKIQFNLLKDFMAFKQFAIKKQYSFHTYSLPEEKTITVVLKGLPNISDLSLQQELNSLGIFYNSCIQINAENSIFATYKINLSAKHSLTQLRKVKFIFHSRVYWDKYINNKTVLQCYRCQAFGHTSSNCFKPPRCVKCALNHFTADCSKTLDVPAKCCNCSGDHPASFTGCPSYQKFLEKRLRLQANTERTDLLPKPNFNTKNLHTKQNSFNNNSHHFPTLNSVSLPPRSNITPSKTFADATKTLNSNKDLSDFNSLLSELNKLSKMVNIQNMLNVICNLNAKLATCHSGFEKLQAFVEAAELIE